MTAITRWWEEGRSVRVNLHQHDDIDIAQQSRTSSPASDPAAARRARAHPRPSLHPGPRAVETRATQERSHTGQGRATSRSRGCAEPEQTGAERAG